MSPFPIQEKNELDDSRYFQYDANSNLIQKIDRNDRYTEFEYDGLNRRVEERWLDPVDDETVIHTIAWTYDIASRVTSAMDAFAEYEYGYDDLNRVTSITAAIAGLTPTVVFAQQFDANGRRTQLAATIDEDEDFVTDYLYDNLSRMTRITQQDVIGGNTVAEKRVDLAYNAAGQFSGIDRYADLAGTDLVAESAYGYDGTGRLTSLAHTKSTTTFAGYGWAFDAANRITLFANSEHSSEDATFTYDAFGQITGADRDGSTWDEDYEYDENGNRTNNGFTATTNNRLDTDGVYDYAYDAEGNTILRTKISDGSHSAYEWDHRNRLVSVTDFDDQDDQLQQVTYAYDEMNRLVSRTVQVGMGSPVSGYFVYDGNQMTLVLNDEGDVDQRLLWGPAVDQILADENGSGDVYWMLTDQQNTVRDVVEYDAGLDETSVANHIVYDSFGRKLSETDDSLDVLTLNYTARFFDAATGLQWNLNRWYNSETGRWLSEDPLGFAADDSNVYRYAFNSPSNLSDPLGLAPLTTWQKCNCVALAASFSTAATGCLLGAVPLCCLAASALVGLLDGCSEKPLDKNQRAFRDLVDQANIACIAGAAATFNWTKLIGGWK